ncbi:MAG: hypothetical protein KJP00_16260 [Bacteroidia bacterium]|nr:hypothetical protein [Bacteroidia bacterium]
MKTRILYLLTLFLFLAFIFSCEKDQTETFPTANLEENDQNKADAAKKPNNPNKPDKPDKPGNDDDNEVAYYKVEFTGAVKYDENYEAELENDSNLDNLLTTSPDLTLPHDPFYVSIIRNNGKVTLLQTIECNGEVTSTEVNGFKQEVDGLLQIMNSCLDDDDPQTNDDVQCGGIGVRQYDKKQDSQKVFTHMGIRGGRISMRGFIQGQSAQAGNETILPENVGEYVLVACDQIRFLLGPQTSCIPEDFVHFNNYNGNNFRDFSRAVLSSFMPDQSITITKIDGDPCADGLTQNCGYPGY